MLNQLIKMLISHLAGVYELFEKDPSYASNHKALEG